MIAPGTEILFSESGLHLLGATNSLFGSIFAPLLPPSSWLYNPLYSTQQYVLEPEWHALALRMAQQRLQRTDQARLEDLRKLRDDTGSPESQSKREQRRNSDGGQRDTDSPDGSIEVDDRNDRDSKKDQVISEESMQDSPKYDSEDVTFMGNDKESILLRPSLENVNESQDDQADILRRHDQLTVKIRVEGTVDLSTRRISQDKENVGQDLTTRRKDEDVEGDKEIIKSRRERSPKPRQVWRPY